jgi:uncharacterized protein (DUF2336 family)
MADSLPPAVDIDETLNLTFEQSLKSRVFLIQRLSDIVCWPATRIPAHERELAADVLVGLLRTASTDLRERCAARLALLVDAPKMLLRYLARDEIGVASYDWSRGTTLWDSPLAEKADGSKVVAAIKNSTTSAANPKT